jgi:glycosidase
MRLRFFLALSVIASACAATPEPSTAPVATHVHDWRDEVIYEVLVDRFDDGDPFNDVQNGVGPVPGDLSRHQGGDWAGLRSRLPYLSNLGVTTIWISPIVANVDRTEAEDGYHGYWASDFTEVNARYGTLEELRALVDDAHGRGMKVIVDVVVNHTGRVFTYDLDEDGEVDADEIEPPYSHTPIEAPVEWMVAPPRMWTASAMLDRDPFAEPELFTLGAEHFHRRGATSWAGEEERFLGDFPTGLRDLATGRDDVLGALVETYAQWVRLTDVDGFRLDAVPHVAPESWARFCGQLRERLSMMGKRRFLLLGEVFTTDPIELARYVEPGMLDTVFDFTFRTDVIDEVILAGRPPTRARRALEEQQALFSDAPQRDGIGLPPYDARVAFADNHDTQRLRNVLDDPYAVELAMTAVFTVDAIPAIYYGTEQGLDGGFHHESREALWETGFDESHPTYAHIARLAEIRRAHPALRYGALEVRFLSPSGGLSTEDDAALFAWERHHEADRVLVAFNAHAYKESVAVVPTGFAAGTTLTDAVYGLVPPTDVGADGSVRLRLPPRSAVVLVP